MRSLLLVAALVCVSGCGSPERSQRRETRILPADGPSWHVERERRVAASASCVTAYLSSHPERPAAIREAIATGALAIGMTLEEVSLVLPGRKIEHAWRTESAAGQSDRHVVTLRTVAPSNPREATWVHVATLHVRDGALERWESPGPLECGPNLVTDMLAYRGP
ncbi:MAG: hypothetical protein KIT58_00160 [Planctomycetota bacterium]|nr:hypothetical protein [Planctomycetota bacterium]